MSEQTQFLTAISGLVSGLVALAGYIVHIHKHHSKKQIEASDKMQALTERYASETKELALEVVKASMRNAMALETNNKLVDKLVDRLS